MSGKCPACGGTHYGSLECPYRCDRCSTNTEPCAEAECPRNRRWAEAEPVSNAVRVCPRLDVACVELSPSQRCADCVELRGMYPPLPTCPACREQAQPVLAAHPDSERLDWLQGLSSVKVDYYLRDGERVYVLHDQLSANPLGHGKTIREAIDYAREACGALPKRLTKPATNL